MRRSGAVLRLVASLGAVAVLATALLAAPILGIGWGARKVNQVYRSTAFPKPKPLLQTTFVYDRHGQYIASFRGAIDRTLIPLGQMPKVLRQAAIAAEDSNFYKETGISPAGIVRALLYNLGHGGIYQGGSTITQQYVKDVYLGEKRSLGRKVKEAILAQKLSRRLSKKEILARYLNEVYFGHSAYGVQAAAQTYFGKDAHDLDLNQAATLAGIIPAPSRYDPILNPDDATIRRDYVLHRMAKSGFITHAEAMAVRSQPLEVSPAPQHTTPGQYFVDFVKKALEQRYGTTRTFGGGLRVKTTIDLRMQRAARRAVHHHLNAKGDPSAALVAMDPRNGQILAMVGGKSRKKTKFNLATQAHRQSGSSFKPYTLAAAVRRGISLLSKWHGPPSLLVKDPRCFTPDPVTNIPGPWNVSNFADESAGTMTLLDATANSVNTIFSQVVLDVGPDRVAQIAHEMGVKSKLHEVCSITLGTQGVTPLDQVTGYSTLAGHGLHHRPQGVIDVTDSQGKEVWHPTGEGNRVLTPTQASLVTYALEGVIQHGTGTAANIGRPAAGKTGTAENFQDAWFCGYVPQLTTCVWVGYPEGEIPMYNIQGFPEVFGGSIPALIWHDFMSEALKGYPVRSFPTPNLNGYNLTPRGSVGGPPLMVQQASSNSSTTGP